MSKAPLSVVKERFGDKAKLVAAVEKLAVEDLWLDRVGAKGLARVPNVKLLRLHEVLETAKKEFGSRKKLIAEILKLENRTKDAGYEGKLEARALPQLLDLHGSASRRAKRVAKAAKPVKATPAKASKKGAKTKAGG
jgi:hypothetical protein